MFTGIIEAMALIQSNSEDRLTIDRPKDFDDIRVGSSIAVSGVCLSISALNAHSMSFDLTETTRQKTTMGSLKQGDRVNLERAMKADARLDGHVVQGHVENVGEVIDRRGERLTVRIPEKLLGSIVQHGSIALDGVSLTVADIDDGCVTIALIPITERETTLGTVQKGDRVNIETDILLRTRAHS